MNTIDIIMIIVGWAIILAVVIPAIIISNRKAKAKGEKLRLSRVDTTSQDLYTNPAFSHIPGNIYAD